MPILTRIINAIVKATPDLMPKLIDAIINGFVSGFGDGLVNFFENMDWKDVFKTMASALEDIARKFIALQVESDIYLQMELILLHRV